MAPVIDVFLESLETWEEDGENEEEKEGTKQTAS